MDKGSLIDLIRKLLALGDKARNNSEAEAETALKKAQELLQKHNIDMAEVIVNENNEKVADIKIEHEIVFTLKRSSMSTWEKWLINIVATATETTGYNHPIRNDNGGITHRVIYMGTEWDRAVAKELYLYLHSTIYRMSKQRYPDSLPSQRSFMEGFVTVLFKRVQDQVNVFNQEQAKNNKYAIVLADKKQAIRKYGEDNLGLVWKKARSRGNTGSFDAAAYQDGKIQGSKVDLGTTQRIPTQGYEHDYGPE